MVSKLPQQPLQLITAIPFLSNFRSSPLSSLMEASRKRTLTQDDLEGEEGMAATPESKRPKGRKTAIRWDCVF